MLRHKNSGLFGKFPRACLQNGRRSLWWRNRPSGRSPRKKKFLLWKQNRQIRYYDIEGQDFSELLDTLNLEVFKEITRRDQLESVLRGIRKAVTANKVRFKINCVPVFGVEKQGILELLNFAKDADVDVRFIEMMPIGFGKHFEFVSEDDLRAVIEETYGPTVNYVFESLLK